MADSAFILIIEGFKDKTNLEDEEVHFKLSNSELIDFSFQFMTLDSKNAKSMTDFRLLNIRGKIEKVLEDKNNNNMHLLRRWSKQIYEGVGYGQGDNYADKFYKQVTISFMGLKTRKIIFKNAYLFEYREKINPRNNSGIFELVVRQNEEYMEQIIVYPFEPIYKPVSNYIDQSDDIIPNNTNGIRFVTKENADIRLIAGIENNEPIGFVNKNYEIELTKEPPIIIIGDDKKEWVQIFYNGKIAWIQRESLRLKSLTTAEPPVTPTVPEPPMVPVAPTVPAKPENGEFNHKKDPLAVITSVIGDDARTTEIIALNKKYASGNSYYKADLAAAGSEKKLHKAMYTGDYCLPFDFGKYTTSNFSQGFWGDHSHKGKKPDDPNKDPNDVGAIDIGAGGKAGIPLYSVLSGKVISVKKGGCYDICIESTINNDKYILEYLHVVPGSSDHLKKDDTVEMGAKIAVVGKSGDPSYAIHLDFRVKDSSGKNMDPLRFFNIDKKVAVKAY